MGTQKYDISTLKHQIKVAKHITTLNKGMGMIALVESHRNTVHMNPKQKKETNEGFKVTCEITNFNRRYPWTTQPKNGGRCCGADNIHPILNEKG